MHPQLILLLELQDLHSQRREMAAGSGMDEMERTHFNMDIGQAADQLDKKIGQLEDALDGRVRDRYRRMANSLGRVVVPVINGLCYGCYVSIPTATAGEQEPNSILQACQHCGRFIYILP